MNGLLELKQIWSGSGGSNRYADLHHSFGRSGTTSNSVIIGIGAVAFDWDGTLANTDDLPALAMKRAIDWARRNQVLLPEYITSRPSQREMTALAKDSRQLANENAVMAKYREFLLDAEAVSTPLMPHAIALLKLLATLRIPMGVVSGRDRFRLIHSIKSSNLESYFSCVVSSDDAYPKPHPAGLWLVSETLKIAPNNILMVGNSQDDRLAAFAAGTRYFQV